MNHLCGIYQIKCISNEKIYIGSSININKRWHRHKDDLRHNKHHSTYLQRAWNKYKEESFKFEVVELCEKETLVAREQYWLDENKGNLFNLMKVAYSSFGYKASLASREKMSKAHLGKRHTEEQKTKIALAQRGSKSHFAKLTEDQVLKIKTRLSNGERQASLARAFDVSSATICDIAKGKIWTHVFIQPTNHI